MRRFQFLLLTLLVCTFGACGRKPEDAPKKSTEAAAKSDTKKAEPADEKKPDQPVVVVEKDGKSEPAVVVTKKSASFPDPGGAFKDDSGDQPLPKKANGKKLVKKDGPPTSAPPSAKPADSGKATVETPPSTSIGPAPSIVADNAELVRVLFGTNRAHNSAIDPRLRTNEAKQKLPFFYLGSARDGLDLGVAEISVPKNRKQGDDPKGGKIGESDPGQYFLLLSITPDSAHFERTLDEEANANQEAMVFIHGFNVPFVDAVFRAAQIKVDLDFKGAMLAFSWPSQGMAVYYRQDELQADSRNTMDALVEFLTRVASRERIKRLHVVAHSMGNRPTQRALAALCAENASKPLKDAAAKLDQIVFAAPDVDTKSNWFIEDVLPRFKTIGKRRTLYRSSNDLALNLSTWFHLGMGRQGGDFQKGLAGLQIVDASNVDPTVLGHSYYGSNPTVLADVRGVLDGRSPEDRSLVIIDRNNNHWTFKSVAQALPTLVQWMLYVAIALAAFFIGRLTRRRTA